jgi:hypothetical protein
MAADEPSSEMDTAAELLYRKLGIERAQAQAILILIIPWLLKRHKKLS